MNINKKLSHDLHSDPEYYNPDTDTFNKAQVFDHSPKSSISLSGEKSLKEINKELENYKKHQRDTILSFDLKRNSDDTQLIYNQYDCIDVNSTWDIIKLDSYIAHPDVRYNLYILVDKLNDKY